MSRSRYRVADVLRACWESYNRSHRLPPHVARTVGRILRCRTAALGGHLHVCDHCGSKVPMYNGCQNRHCPSCQGSAREKWLEQRYDELLPVQYFHVVFTLPHKLNGLIDANRKLLLGELFSVVGWVLQRFAKDPQWRLEGELGYIAMLHTWTQRLMEHFHVHCLVPGGVWQADSRKWIPCRGKWLFRKDSLCAAFRNRFIKRLQALRKREKLNYAGRAAPLESQETWDRLIEELSKETWIVYPKATPASPAKALEYLGRYTHKVAISDHRIKAIANDKVTYSWRDRSDHNNEKLDTISVEEFTQRFIAHILPDRFHRIRYGGWMSANRRKKVLPAIRAALQTTKTQTSSEETQSDPRPHKKEPDPIICPCCGKGHLQRTSIRIFPSDKKPP